MKGAITNNRGPTPTSIIIGGLVVFSAIVNTRPRTQPRRPCRARTCFANYAVDTNPNIGMMIMISFVNDSDDTDVNMNEAGRQAVTDAIMNMTTMMAITGRGASLTDGRRKEISGVSVLNGPGAEMTTTFMHCATMYAALSGGIPTRQQQQRQQQHPVQDLTIVHKAYDCTSLNGKGEEKTDKTNAMAWLTFDLSARHAAAPTVWPLNPRANKAQGGRMMRPLLGRTDRNLNRSELRNQRAEPS